MPDEDSLFYDVLMGTCRRALASGEVEVAAHARSAHMATRTKTDRQRVELHAGLRVIH